MKPFSKPLIVCFSALSLLSSAFLSGCSASAGSNSAISPSTPAVNKDDEGYTIWTMGENNLGDGIIVNLTGMKEEENSAPRTEICADLELYSTQGGIIDDYRNLGACGNILSDSNGAKKQALKEKYQDHIMLLATDTNGSEEDVSQKHLPNVKYGTKAYISVGQVPLSSVEPLEARVKEWDDHCLPSEKNDFYGKKITDGIYVVKPHKRMIDYCIYKDGMLTVVHYEGPQDSAQLNNLVTW